MDEGRPSPGLYASPQYSHFVDGEAQLRRSDLAETFSRVSGSCRYTVCQACPIISNNYV